MGIAADAGTDQVADWFTRRLRSRHPVVRAIAVAASGYAVLVGLLAAVGYAITAVGAFDWVAHADRDVTTWLAEHRTGPLGTLAEGFGATSVAVAVTAARTWPSPAGASRTRPPPP